jgi:Rieske Fe-S protein
MTCDACSGYAHTTSDTCSTYKEASLAVTPRPLSRRNTLIAGATAAMLFALGRIPGGSTASAFAADISKKFRKPAGSRKVGTLHSLHAGSALTVRDPKTGGPAVVVRPTSAKKVHAFSAVCTHAGCTVNYNPANKLLVCPCHGSVYDPAHGASVLQGPAPYPLTSLKVAIDPKGNIWLV